jgi:hypothetical protein
LRSTTVNAFPEAPVALIVEPPGKAAAGMVMLCTNLPVEETGTKLATRVVVTSVKSMFTVVPGLKLKPETVIGQPALPLVADRVM